jgi:hypothetical protein
MSDFHWPNKVNVINTVPVPVTVTGALVSFNLDAVETTVSQDTAVPANSTPLPVQILNSVGVATPLATEATLSTLNGKVTACNTGAVVVSSSALPTGAATEAKQDTGNTSVASIDTKTPALVAGRVPVDGSGVTQPVSAASLPLPTGAATEATLAALAAEDFATQTTLAALNAKVTACNTGAVVVSSSALPTGAATETTLAALAAEDFATETTLSALNAKVAANYGAATGAVRVAAQIGNASAVADFAAGNASAQTLRVVIATDQAGVQTKAPVNSNGSNTDSTVSTVATLTAPANAVGFILVNLDTSTAGIRWRIGATATSSSGQQLQVGRDTGYIPCAANISICAESGTQNYNVQWILSS